MKPSRGVGWRGLADSAGTIESSRGSASVAPTPRRKVRRCKVFFVMKLVIAPTSLLRTFWLQTPYQNRIISKLTTSKLTTSRLRRCCLHLAHLKRGAFYHSQHQ